MASVDIILASDPTEKYLPLPSREAHFPKQPELPSQQQLFILGPDQLQYFSIEENKKISISSRSFHDILFILSLKNDIMNHETKFLKLGYKYLILSLRTDSSWKNRQIYIFRHVSKWHIAVFVEKVYNHNPLLNSI